MIARHTLAMLTTHKARPDQAPDSMIGRSESLPAMIDAARYSAIETLRDGRRVEMRALRPEDRSARNSSRSRQHPVLYRRFFAVKRFFTERETDFFVNVDFVNHVALVAVVDEDGQAAIVGSSRYVLVQPGKAEVAFAVIDAYQGQGVGSALMRHLAAISREAGLQQLVADVLPENIPMLRLFQKCGCRMNTRLEAEVVRVTLGLN
jgi:RimJ/RimL family protein N-acetyltransferase